MFNKDILAENIKKYRNAKKLTQKELADILKISPQSISKWECAQAVPDIENLYDISSIFGVSLDALAGNSETANKNMIAVNGGTAKTEFVLFDDEGRIINSFFLKGCNPSYTDMDEIFATLKSGINILLGHSPNPLGIYIGISGYTVSRRGNEIKEKMKQLYPHIKLRCKSDIYSIIASASTVENCISAKCATDIVVYVTENNSLHRFGSWDMLLSNGGSIFDIGKDVLRSVLLAREGRGAKNRLTELAESKLGGDIPDNLSENISFVESFASVAFDAYEEGDKNAEEILKRNALRFAELINHAAKTFPHCKALIITSNHHAYIDMVKPDIDSRLKIVIPANPPIYGACLKCADMCGVSTDKIKKNFMKYYNKENSIYE